MSSVDCAAVDFAHKDRWHADYSRTCDGSEKEALWTASCKNTMFQNLILKNLAGIVDGKTHVL
jgi:hypothetical protein